MSGLPGAAAVVLAAGRAQRYGGDKLLAELDGRPLLQHVLDAAALAGLRPVIVVLPAHGERLQAAISWRHEQRVINPTPAAGLSSSLRLGLEALQGRLDPPDRAVILLGDQPRLSRAQLAILLAHPPDERRPIVVPRYDDGRPGNPVLLERAAWSLAAGLTGDRGMSQLFTGRPELVRFADVPGLNPDVDTPADLEMLR
jgi:molybdenum cofactor cytidylyltransferase